MSRNVRLYISGFILIISIILFNIGSEANGVLAHKQQNNFPLLLLESGLTEASEAEAQVTFWFEEEKDDSNSSFLREQVLSQAGWKWESQEVELPESDSADGLGSKQALTVSGYRFLDASEEAEVLTWFTAMAKKVELEGGKAYFDERVQAEIDAEAYLHQNNFEPKQGVISGETVSIAGWQEGFFPAVQAGKDTVNIQLLTRSTSQGAKTVLAIPVLLEEF